MGSSHRTLCASRCSGATGRLGMDRGGSGWLGMAWDGSGSVG